MVAWLLPSKLLEEDIAKKALEKKSLTTYEPDHQHPESR